MQCNADLNCSVVELDACMSMGDWGSQPFELVPFSYMSFFSADRQQYYADTAAHLYSPLAYHLSTSLAGEHPNLVLEIGVHALNGTVLWRQILNDTEYGISKAC